MQRIWVILRVSGNVSLVTQYAEVSNLSLWGEFLVSCPVSRCRISLRMRLWRPGTRQGDFNFLIVLFSAKNFSYIYRVETAFCALALPDLLLTYRSYALLLRRTMSPTDNGNGLSICTWQKRP